MVTAGSYVDPAATIRFKSQLRRNNIIKIREDELPKWKEFFKARYGVDMGDPPAFCFDEADKPAAAETQPVVPQESEVTAAQEPEPTATETEVSEDDLGTCKAIKGNGERCTNKALPGSDYCGVHSK